MLVDASEGLVDQDLAVADVARKAQCSTIVVLSKWGIGETKLEDVRPRIEGRARRRAPAGTPRARPPARLCARARRSRGTPPAAARRGGRTGSPAGGGAPRTPPPRHGRRLN